MAKLNPLNWNVPIVDAQGHPTPEFQQKWRQQSSINGSIPELSTTEQVSSILDLIGGTAGDLLRRGATVWEVIDAVGGTSKFLRADGTYAVPPQQTVDESEIDLSDVLTNNVSATRHGFAPKLPNDSSKFLDGTGAYSTLSGGGGGGGAYLAELTIASTALTSSNHAVKGNIYTARLDGSFAGVGVPLQAASYNGTYRLGVCKVDASNKIISSVSYSDSQYLSTSDEFYFMLPSAFYFSAGDIVAFFINRTDGADTSRVPVYYPPDVGNNLFAFYYSTSINHDSLGPTEGEILSTLSGYCIVMNVLHSINV